ncbi:MAG: acyl-CoA thioesterase [Desulfuromonadales bacterium]|nr:acyl-CoA thioesterase [Desulfuromonadales bacterium]
MIELKAEIQLKIPFQDVDVMGIVWHGNYLRYFEEARAELLDKVDYGYFQMKESGYAWPIVDARVKYIKPLHLQQIVQVKARLVEYECQLKIEYEVFDVETGERTTKGYTKQVAVDMESNEMCFVTPKVFLEKLGVPE